RPSGDRFTVRLFRGGVEYVPNAGVVARELQRLWTEHRRRFDVRAEAMRLLAMPEGQFIDAGTAGAIQDKYPTVYGMNRFGVGPDATAARRAQAKQFKAYLLPFEQLLADSFVMLGGFTDLCAIDAGPRQHDSRGYLDGRDATDATLVPDVAPLLSDS